MKKDDFLPLNEDTIQRAVKSFQKQLPSLTLMDDYYLMLYAKRYPEDFSMILSEFLGKPVEVDEKTFQIQHVVVSPDDARDVRFDIAVDSKKGERIVLEVESRKKFGELRLRYYMAKQDSNLLRRGETYKNLPDAYSIVVARHDIKGDGEPRYVMRMCYVKSIDEIGNRPAIVKDGRAAIYINAGYKNEKDSSPLANLIHDFTCKKPEDMRNESLKKHSTVLKNTREGRDDMTSEVMATVDKLPLFAGKLLTYEERMEEREEGREEGREDIFKRLIFNALHSENRNVLNVTMTQVMQIGKKTKEELQSIVQLVAKENNLKIPDGLFDDDVAPVRPQE